MSDPFSRDRDRKPLARSLGEFFGHIWKAVKTDAPKERTVIDRQTVERREGNVIVRETRVREIEVDRPVDGHPS